MKKFRILLLLIAIICASAALSSCGIFAPTGTKHEHIGGDPVKENTKDATCSAEGSFDEVVYCKRCDDEMSRTKKTLPIKPDAHKAADATEENRAEATCKSDGSYEMATYCSLCNKELSRITHLIEKLAHGFDGDACKNCDTIRAINGLEYVLNADGLSYTLSGLGSCTDTKITIDNFYNLPVTAIGKKAFWCAEAITEISIADSVKSIEWGAFFGCSSLTTAYFDGTEIEWSKVIIDASNSPIVNADFTFKEKAPEVSTDPEVGPEQSSSGLVFDLNEDGLGYTLTGKGTCQDEVVYVTKYKGLPVTAIKAHSFYESENLKEIYIGADVKTIGASAFNKCYLLEKITFYEGSSLEQIGENAFMHCDALVKLTLPDSVLTIGSQGFALCHNLISVELGASLQTINPAAFFGCYKLVEIINNSSLAISIGATSNGYIGFYAIESHTGESKIENINDFVFYSTGSENYLIGYSGNDETLTLPESYGGASYIVSQYAFYNNQVIKSIHIPDAVKEIKNCAFMWCTALESITFANTSAIEAIASSTFYGCANLISIALPESVTDINSFAFAKCLKLGSITLGAATETIGESAFNECPMITDVYCSDSTWASLTIAAGNDALQSAIRHP